MTYGTASVNHTPSAQWQWFPNNRTTVSAKYLGFCPDANPHVAHDRTRSVGNDEQVAQLVAYLEGLR